MEMKKRRQKTLTGLFLKFAALFCLDTFGIGMFCLVLLVLSPMTGFTLPANYAELQLTDHTEEIKAAGTDVEALIPDGCRYGIYDAAGQFKTGTFSADAQKRAWQGYKNGSKYASMGKYYRYIKQNSGDICIVKYDLHMRYAYDKLNGIVPSLEILTPALGVVLFFLHATLLSGHFAKKLKRELRQLREVTEKIGQNDLEFETGPSQIKEIDDVMSSLSGMKEALKDSLTRQWDAQQQKKEQLAALTHDIKTPLTVIKGNAELLAETDLSAENRECTDAILANVGSMAQYLEHLRLIEELKRCVRNDFEGFELYYQPIVEPKSMQIVECEALLRWKNGRFPGIGPAKFIPILEETGMMKEVGAYAVRTAISQVMDFSDSLIVNVNVSYKQLKDDDFAEYVLGILKEYQFPPERLMMELTESCKAHDLPVLMRTMNKLREHRVLVALDDFGTGYASLDILQDISVDCLKIEQCFVAECEKNNVDRNIIKHIILLAHSLGLKVCMEGVETEGIYDVAVEEQADILQGYYFSRPVPAGDFQKMLRRSAGHGA